MQDARMPRAVPRSVARSVERLLGNPLDVPADEREEAVRTISRASPSGLSEWAAALGAEPVALAVAVSAIGAGREPSEALVAARSVLREPKSAPLASELVRIASASSRCTSALAAIAGESDALTELRRATWGACFGRSMLHARHVARVIRDHDVLVTGETGTGKELVAEAILAGAFGPVDAGPPPRAALNVAAVPETLVESELFGHRRGAFTGATADRRGLIRSVDGGCLFLDEVGELPPTVQAKLLRVIETDRVQAIGSDVTHAVDVRFVGATHRDLRAAIEAGTFREDLYQRLAGTVLHVPPLRERPGDVVAIGERFLEEIPLGGPMAAEIARVRRWLHGDEARRHAYPGNVRQLKNALRNLLLGLPHALSEAPASPALRASFAGEVVPERIRGGSATLAEVEAWYAHRALEASRGNVAAAARLLGIDRTTLARKQRSFAGAGVGGSETGGGELRGRGRPGTSGP